jgi:hypothetical protein
MAIRTAPLAIVSSLTLVLIACAEDGTPRETATPAATPTATPEATPDASPGEATSTPGPEAVCLEGESFVTDGMVPIEIGSDGDAAELGGLRWATHEVCERLVIDLLGEDGAAATVSGTVEARVLRELGLVRVSLPGVERVAMDPAGDAAGGVTEIDPDGWLMDAAYVVRSEEDRSLFVDVHLADPAEAHVFTLADPARIVVDLRSGGDPVPGLATRDQGVVIVSPRDGDDVTYPLEVTGYARTFEANILVRLDQDGEDRFTDNTTASDWTETWGWFSLTIDEGPVGAVIVHAGEHSARDGAWQGADVAVEIEE